MDVPSQWGALCTLLTMRELDKLVQPPALQGFESRKLGDLSRFFGFARSTLCPGSVFTLQHSSAHAAVFVSLCWWWRWQRPQALHFLDSDSRVCRSNVANEDLHDALVDTQQLLWLVRGIEQLGGPAWSLGSLVRTGGKACGQEVFADIKAQRLESLLKQRHLGLAETEEADLATGAQKRSSGGTADSGSNGAGAQPDVQRERASASGPRSEGQQTHAAGLGASSQASSAATSALPAPAPPLTTASQLPTAVPPADMHAEGAASVPPQSHSDSPAAAVAAADLPLEPSQRATSRGDVASAADEGIALAADVSGGEDGNSRHKSSSLAQAAATQPRSAQLDKWSAAGSNSAWASSKDAVTSLWHASCLHLAPTPGALLSRLTRKAAKRPQCRSMPHGVQCASDAPVHVQARRAQAASGLAQRGRPAEGHDRRRVAAVHGGAGQRRRAQDRPPQADAGETRGCGLYFAA